MSSSKNNLIAKNTMMLYIRLSIVMIVYLYTSRIVLKALGIEDYGIYNVVAGVITLFSFFNGALSSATSRFITYELGRENRIGLEKNFRTAFTIHLILAGIILILAETIGLWFVNNKLIIPVERLFAANIIYQFSVLSCVVTIMQVPLNAEIIAHEKMTIYAYMGILDASSKLLIAFFINTCNSDKLIAYGFLLFVTTILLFLVYHIYCKRKFGEYNPSLFYDKSTFKGMLSYSGWSLWGSMAYVLKDQGVNMALNIFFGPVVNAARGITYQVNTALNSFTQNFTIAMNPQIVKSYACNDYNRMFLLFFTGAKFSFFLLLLFCNFDLNRFLYFWFLFLLVLCGILLVFRFFLFLLIFLHHYIFVLNFFFDYLMFLFLLLYSLLCLSHIYFLFFGRLILQFYHFVVVQFLVLHIHLTLSLFCLLHML